MSQTLPVLAFQYGLSTTNTKEHFVILLVTPGVENCLVVVGRVTKTVALLCACVICIRPENNVIGKTLHLCSVVQNSQ